MAKKKVAQESESESSEEEQQFVVEVIKAARVKKGNWEYRVKWANYDSSDDTWEPGRNLTNCSRLLSSFWQNVGMDNEDYFEGYEVKATPTWIKREKKLFASTLNKDAVVEESSGEDEPMPSTSHVKTGPTRKRDGKPPVIKKRGTVGRPPKAKPKRERSLGEDDDESDSLPLSAVRKKGKQRAKPIVDSDDDDDDDEPLAKPKKPLTAPTVPRSTKPPEARNQKDAEHSDSDSAGSLFSEKSSPEVALNALPPTTIEPPTKTKSSIPAKRPTSDDASQGQRKRQVMEMPMEITGIAGNATKARLAQRVPPSVQQTGKRDDLKNLKFKKNSAVDPSLTQPTKPVPPPLPRRSASASEHGQSPGPRGPGISAIGPHSPLSVSNPPPPTAPGGTLPLPRRNLSLPQQSQSPVTESMAEANKFLSEIMPAAMASPMRDDQVSERPPPVPVRPAQIKAAALPRIQKKWKWTGDLFMDISRDRAERVCSVLLSDSTDPRPNGLRFSICLTGDSIRLSAFHDLASLPVFLLASTRVQQFAKVGPAEETDTDAIKQIGKYMMKNSLFCFAHLYMDNASVGLLLAFPTGHKLATDILRVPPDLSSDTPVQVALVPWELTTKEFRANTWKMRSPTLECTLDPKLLPVLDSAGRKVVTQRRFYQALHILGFPKETYDYMKNSVRQYCVWIGNADTTLTGAGYETSLLKLVLSGCKGQDVGLKANVKIIFVHVGGLASLHHMGALAERRMKTSARFMTYGSHPSVPRDRWGMREIYPIGGILTFTPTAIVQNHGLLYDVIKQISEHPVWDCYVLPSVVAMVAKLTCQGRHPLRVYDEGEFVYEELLNLIEEGSVSLAQAPQVARDPLSQGDASLVWTRWTLRLAAMNARQILEECLRLAAEQFAGTSEANLPQAIEEEIARDLLRLQNQPVIMDNYRRFTVVRTQQDKFLAHDMRGFECTTLANFKFGDDCFDCTTKPDTRRAEKK